MSKLIVDYPNAILIQGDAREVIPQLKGLIKFDLLVTDPPYGINYQSDYREEKFDRINGDHDTSLAIDVIKYALSVLKEYRHLYIFGKYDLSALNIGGIVELIWDKEHLGVGDLSSTWGKSHEYIQFGIYIHSRVAINKGRGNLTARLRKGSVLCSKRLHGEGMKYHPTEKPVDLLRQLIESSSVMDDWVFDPFVGVGSTMVAALLEGRKVLGIEIEEKYCLIAKERIEKTLKQLEQLEEK